MAVRFYFDNDDWKKVISQYLYSTTTFKVDTDILFDNKPTLNSDIVTNTFSSNSVPAGYSFTLKESGYIKFAYYTEFFVDVTPSLTDYFQVIIDEVEVFRVTSQNISWSTYEYPLTAGKHKIKFDLRMTNPYMNSWKKAAIGYIELEGLYEQKVIEDNTTILNNPFEDKQFLKELDNQNLQNYYAKILVLDFQENPIQEITGRISAGSININGDSSIRRTCNLTFLADKENNDLTNINNLLSINKKIKIFVGVQNNIERKYDEIIWFPQGVYVICQPNISNSINGLLISLSCKDKMCLLNGECGGGLPAPITFDSYDQLQPDGTRISVPQVMYDIIQTLVCNYGGEAISKIFISDVPREIKQIVRYVGSLPLYYNSKNHIYTTDNMQFAEDPRDWYVYEYNENIGYVYTDFIYPGTLQSGIGDNICSVLDKIKNTLGNYEYFYDIDGNFIFREIKNYLNNSYDATDIYRLDNNRIVEVADNNLAIVDNVSYKVDFYSNNKFAYNFEEGTGLISSYSNTPSYTNIKNDFHIWGKNGDNLAIHYHLAIKEKPKVMNTYQVVFLTDDTGEYTGRLRLATADEIAGLYNYEDETLNDNNENNSIIDEVYNNTSELTYINEGNESLFVVSAEVVNYIPTDWRAELYLQGLTKQQMGIRPDIYEQELLDLFDTIYDFQAKTFKSDIVNRPNELKYFIDFLEPAENMFDIAVNHLYPKTHSYQQDNINRLYNNDIPDVILIDVNADIMERAETISRCELEGQPYANIDSVIYSNLATSVLGYAAQEVARDLLYRYTDYNEQITLQSRPIYYLDANNLITVFDKESGIHGNFIIKTLSVPLDGKSMMSINASRALERI